MVTSTATSSPDADCSQWLESATCSWSDADRLQLQRACEFLKQGYGTQLRRSGDSYRQHALEVTRLLCDLHLDPNTLTAALLHDCPQADPQAAAGIAEHFGDEVS